ncbi:hypothetical protein [Tessaracoccus sp. G1721]
MNRKSATAPALVLAALLLALGSLPAPAGAETVGIPSGLDEARGCVYNGFPYAPTAGVIAAGPHCFSTPDDSGRPVVAGVDPSKTAADLASIQGWSPLHPDHYVARGTFATRLIGDAPRAANSAAIATFVSDALPRMYLPDTFDPWLRMGANVGDGVHAHDNIPIYTVDSSNPYQEFAVFASTDARVVNFPRLKAVTTGRLPIPSWARASDGGDRAFATFDVATGIMRGYYNAVKAGPDLSEWHFAASGYWYGDPETRSAGADNYWLGYLTGSNSVIGISNELTQIGAEEVRRGEIGHMVSLTFPDYQRGVISFPAKQTDGGLDPAAYPDAPAAGQVFTFPKAFDVEAYVKANGIDPTMAAVMRAVQKYGGIVSDKNTFVMALNFESPYGMGNGVNPWKSDPELASRINNLTKDKFPWALTEWLPIGYAAHLTNAADQPAPAPPAVPETSTAPRPEGVYYNPGYATSGGRRWFTRCEEYTAELERCFAYIWATEAVQSGRGWTTRDAWVFNNLSYLPAPRAAWGGNPLAVSGSFTSGGRQWRTSCADDWTGPNGCRSFIWARVPVFRDGSYRLEWMWVFNNVVAFTG